MVIEVLERRKHGCVQHAGSQSQPPVLRLQSGRTFSKPAISRPIGGHSEYRQSRPTMPPARLCPRNRVIKFEPVTFRIASMVPSLA